MNEFSYWNERDSDLMINLISEEILYLINYKQNLIKFAYLESIKGKLVFYKYKNIIDECERISVEIYFCEQIKLKYIKFKEKT